MNSRERFLKTINGEKADRVPIVANLTIQVAEKLAKELNLEVEFIASPLATRISHRSILLNLGNDAVIIASTNTKSKPTIKLPNGNVKDEWGIEYENIGLYSEAVVRPLSSCENVSDIEKYDFPKADNEERWDFALDTMAKYKNDYGIIGDLEACLYEMAWNLIGMEKFMMDMATEEEYIEVLLDKILYYSIEAGKKMVSMGVDLIWTGDYMGTQNAMMISPQLWKKYFKPRMQKMFNEFKKLNPSIKIAYHSCGAISPIIDDLIEIGLDILNPLQPLAKDMELSSVYKKYNDKLIFFGGIDVQGILPNGNTLDVENEVKRCFEATDGGKKYIIAPAHNIQPDTPIENIYAFFNASKKYGIIK